MVKYHLCSPTIQSQVRDIPEGTLDLREQLVYHKNKICRYRKHVTKILFDRIMYTMMILKQHNFFFIVPFFKGPYFYNTQTEWSVGVVHRQSGLSSS